MTIEWDVQKTENPTWWNARVSGADEGRSYRIVRRNSEPCFELHVELQPNPSFELPFSTLEEAKDTAEGMEYRAAQGPHGQIENGFAVQYRSTIDGDRHVIIDERLHDMTGWQIETTGGSRGNQVNPFTREEGWYCHNGYFNCFGSSNGDYRHPWSAWCNHGEKILRWIPPKA
ncbi:MAG: hypothetical protein WCK99_12905 [Mycobacteriaceae bacterium]